MGGCATKPRELKGEADAPRPLEEAPIVPEPKAEGDREERKEVQGGEKTEKAEGAEGQPEEKRRRSLGLLFREKEEINIASEVDKVVVKETITSPIEAKIAAEEPKKVEQSSEESVLRTVAPEVSNATLEETSAPVSVTSEAIGEDSKVVSLGPKEEAVSIVKEIVDPSNEIGQGESVTEEKESEVPAFSVHVA